MGVLCIVSAEKGSGKTALGAGLAIYLANSGKNVGYKKYPSPDTSDADTTFMQQVLGKPDIDKPEGKDVFLVETMLGTSAEDTYQVAAEMKARVIAVETYTGKPARTELYKGFGQDLLGIIVNKVPESVLGKVKEEATEQFSKSGIKLLAVIPENRTLLAVTVGELAEVLPGKILNNPEKSDELVENYMLGAMVVDSGLDYFGRMGNKAAIIRQDRPDMQLAALETSTRCLILSDNTESPLYNVLQKAESHGIPIIAVGVPSQDIVDKIEETILNTRLHQEKKLRRLADIVKQNLDIDGITG